MKKLLILFVSATLSAITSAQAPEQMSFQAVVRNISGELITGQKVGMQVSILQGSENGTLIYRETQTPNTNTNGVVSISIGTGSTNDDFSNIDWADGPYFIKTETDPTGGVNYTVTGTNQLLSVPYAMHAKTAEYTQVTSQNIQALNSDEIAELQPTTGELVYNTSESIMLVYSGKTWQVVYTTCWPLPSQAYAGKDQTIEDGTTSTSLEGNILSNNLEKGTWSIISGEGGSFLDSSSPTTVFNGVIRTTYTLQWVISTPCDVESSLVNITFAHDKEGESITDIDGNTYATVWIGSQCWMAENLKVKKYPNGDTIPNIKDNTSWKELDDDDTADAYSAFENSMDSAEIYGYLYTYAAAIADDWTKDNYDNQGICPDGWHLPSDSEWKTLEMYLGMSQGYANNYGIRGTDEGNKLKSASGWKGGSNGGDNYGFSALPGGYRNFYSGAFLHSGSSGYWWCETQYNNPFHRKLEADASTVFRTGINKSSGLSVRCVKD